MKRFLLIMGLLVLAATPAYGAIAHVQSTKGNNTTGTSLAVAYVSNNTAGNLLIAGAGGYGAGTLSVSDTLGNTWTSILGADDTDPYGNHFQFWYAQNSLGGANTVTVSSGATSEAHRLHIYEYSGAATTGVLDKNAQSNGNGASLDSTATATTTQADEMVFGMGTQGSQGVTIWTPGTGFTLRTTDGGLAFEDKQVTVVGAYNATFTNDSGDFWRCYVATFKAAGGGGGAPPRQLPTMGCCTFSGEMAAE